MFMLLFYGQYECLTTICYICFNGTYDQIGWSHPAGMVNVYSKQQTFTQRFRFESTSCHSSVLCHKQGKT